MLTLFYAPHTCSLAAHIALVEAGAEFESLRLDFSTGEQNAANYLKINPKGRVPALATEQGVVTETLAILAYIAQSFPQKNLAPPDAFGFAQMQAFNAYLSSTVHPAHAHKRRGARWSDDPEVIEAMTIKVPKNMADCFNLIENTMLQGPWVMGAQYTVADAYLFTLSGWLVGDGVDPSLFPRVAAHRHAMLTRPAVAAAVKAHEAS